VAAKATATPTTGSSTTTTNQSNSGTAPGAVATTAANTSSSQAPSTFGFKVSNTDGEGLRVRQAPGLAAPIVGRLPEGTPILAADGSPVDKDGESWVAVRFGQSVGWAAVRYLTKFSLPVIDPKGLPSDASFGQRAASLALTALGKPYAWGAAGPTAFDCSGLAQWVYKQAGLSVARTIPQQLEAGSPVAVNDLKPGDLLAYVRTYTEGLSHVAIYLGNNQMVHAADETQGVKISSTDDPYWKSRFYVAVRLR
jgi:cell wall-associated NlpC family hydrolase